MVGRGRKGKEGKEGGDRKERRGGKGGKGRESRKGEGRREGMKGKDHASSLFETCRRPDQNCTVCCFQLNISILKLHKSSSDAHENVP